MAKSLVMNFQTHELKKLHPGSEIEVILDELESIDGNVVLSYEKAKALKLGISYQTL